MAVRQNGEESRCGGYCAPRKCSVTDSSTLEATLALETRDAPAPRRSPGASDAAMMTRCIELSRIAADKGEYPFGTVIALDGEIVAEGINTTLRDADVTRHGEVIALSDAQKRLGEKGCAAARSIPTSNPVRCVLIAFARPGSAGWSMPSPRR